MLAIDAGNTNVTVARLTDGAIAARQTIARDRIAARNLGSTLEALGPSDGAILASVVPALTPLLVEALAVATGAMPHPLSHLSPHGLRFAVPAPETAGADRIAAACGALTHTRPPLIVVDCGTATVLTVVDADGDGTPLYRGGAIAPGGGTSLAALRERAPHLPAPAVPPLAPIGDTSAMAIAIGAFAGHGALIDGLIDRLAAALRAGMGATGGVPVLVTGGWAPHCLSHLRHPHTHDPDLVLRGLAAVAARL
jgi:type III pantothenate kinase